MHRILLALAAALLVVGCSSGGARHLGPSATLPGPSSTTSAAEAATVKKDVEAAYLRSWDVYAKAALELSPTGLESTFLGKALDLARYDVQRLADAGTPGRYQVDHHLSISLAGSDEAQVRDDYVNHSVALDGSSHQPIENDPNEPVSQTYTLKKVNSNWYVTDIERS